MKFHPEPSVKKPLYTAMTAAELLKLPPKDWTIPGVLPATGLGVIYGPPNVGKSFLTIDLFIAIAEGQPWLGKKTKARGAVYLALEGIDGIVPRLRAWITHHGRPIPATAKFLRDSDLTEAEFSLDNDEDVECLAATIASLDLGDCPVIFIDTLSAAMLGMDENSSAEMGAALRRLRRLIKRLGGMVILVAHSGKDPAKGLRGSSKLPADCDSIFQVRQTRSKRAIRIEKQRDASVGDEWTFELLEVPYGLDEEENALTSCVVRTAGTEHGKAGHKAAANSPDIQQARLGENEQIVLAVAGELVQKDGERFTSEVNILAAFRSRYQGSARHAPSRCKSAIASLVDRGHLIVEAGRVRLP
jgi:hypothetical protein